MYLSCPIHCRKDCVAIFRHNFFKEICDRKIRCSIFLRTFSNKSLYLSDMRKRHDTTLCRSHASKCNGAKKAAENANILLHPAAPVTPMFILLTQLPFRRCTRLQFDFYSFLPLKVGSIFAFDQVNTRTFEQDGKVLYIENVSSKSFIEIPTMCSTRQSLRFLID